MLIVEQLPSIRKWAEKRLECQFNEAVTLAEYQDGKIIAVTVLNNFRKHGCEISFVSCSPKWATRRYIKEVFNFCFNHAGYRRLSALTVTTNGKAIKTLERLGFIREGLLREAADNGKNMWIYSMLKNECRWI